MKRSVLLTLVLALTIISIKAQNSLWSDISNELLNSSSSRKSADLPLSYRLVKLNRAEATRLQQATPVEHAQRSNHGGKVLLDIPFPVAGSFKAAVVESPILSKALQASYPDIKTYSLSDPVTGNSRGRITITADGITGLLFTDSGSIYINPLGKEYPDVHIVYYSKQSRFKLPVSCGVPDVIDGAPEQNNNRLQAGDCMSRTYRLAVAATGEYVSWAGSQANALAYITTTVNNVSAIYERDANIRFTLVSNNSVLFTNAASDPYPTIGFPDGTFLNTNNSTLNTNLGSGNFDLGIVFSNDWNGGLAQLNAVCTANKGRGAAGLTFGTGTNPVAGPQGPQFDNMVAHEIGHEFSATHTMASNNSGCSGNNTAASAWEPGGGSTIMAYAGVCDPNYYQFYSDDYFHGGNILQILNFATTSATCIVPAASGNAAPSVSVAATAYTIPVSTPFELNATATDADGNTLLYSWEEVDANLVTSSAPASTNTTGPMFRSYPGTTASSRVFPRIADIVAGVSPTYEVLPSVSRSMDFLVTVRDQAAGGGCTDEELVTVTTDASAGPFVVTSQSTPENWTADGSNTVNITWNVAGTNAAPVNCSNVDIMFSVDGGLTYPYTLLAGTANDGAEVITVPSLPTNVGRIRIQASDNIFFNINTADITITSSCSAEGATVSPASTVTANAGDAALDLSLSPAYGSVVTPTGTLESTDPASSLAVNNLSVGSCINFGGNEYRYDSYRFTVNVAGSYTFARTSGSTSLIFNLYNDNFNSGDPCSNFIRSNGTYNGSGVSGSSSYSETLTPGVFYTLTVGTFAAGSPSVPAAYTITVTPPGGGGLFSSTPDPGAGFNYTYIIVDNSSGNILAIDPAADLSNSASFGAGDYTVYGLSYNNSIAPATLNGYIGGAFSNLENDALYNPSTLCSNLSKNSVAVNIVGTLPVEMLPLKAQKAGETILLSWATASEHNSSHFEILRSADGSRFEKLPQTIPAQGFSQQLVNYGFVDYAPLNAVNYYRIREVDQDGRSMLSNIVSVDMSSVSTNTRTILYPNPAHNSVQWVYYAAEAEQVELQLLDSKGALIAVQQITTRSGRNEASFNITALANGVYVVKAITSGNTSLSRFIKK